MNNYNILDPIINTPSNKNVKNLINRFQKNINIKNHYYNKNYKSRIFFVPHAGIEYSGYTTLYSYFNLIPNINDVWLFGTNHRPNRIKDNNTMFKYMNNINTMNIKNYELSKAAKSEHSININVQLLKPYLKNNSKIYPWLFPKDFSNYNKIIKLIIDFLNKNENNIVVFTSDMSHEYNKSSMEIINNEANLISDILNMNYENAFEEINKLTMCGPENLKLFLMLIYNLNLYPIIAHYEDSKNKSYLWTNEKHDYIVSYLSLTTTDNKKFYEECKYNFLINLHKSFVLSKINELLLSKNKNEIYLPNNLKLTNINKGIFITIYDNFNTNTKSTRACIGRFYIENSNLYDYIINIIPSLIEDSSIRWNKPLNINELNDKKLNVSFSIMDNDKEVLNINEFRKKNINNNDRKYTYIIQSKNGNKKGSFIPSVWLENPSWNSEIYLNHLKRKANINYNNVKNINLYKIKTNIF